MVSLTRRVLLGAGGAAALLGAGVLWERRQAARPGLALPGPMAVPDGPATGIGWSDLLPAGEAPWQPEIGGVVWHGGAERADQPPASGFRHDWDGRMVRLPGYVVPLDGTSGGVTLFLLVPFVGACIHVPPPPANQVVLVTADRPYSSGSLLFAPVRATGVLSVARLSTGLAEVGYALRALRVDPLRG